MKAALGAIYQASILGVVLSLGASCSDNVDASVFDPAKPFGWAWDTSPPGPLQTEHRVGDCDQGRCEIFVRSPKALDEVALRYDDRSLTRVYGSFQHRYVTLPADRQASDVHLDLLKVLARQFGDSIPVGERDTALNEYGMSLPADCLPAEYGTVTAWEEDDVLIVLTHDVPCYIDAIVSELIFVRHPDRRTPA